jgi:hypothetical protein
MSDNVVQLQPEFPDDYCICLDDLDNQEEVSKMLQFVDDQLEEALHAVSTDMNPVRGYIRAKNIMECAFDLLPLEEIQKMLDAYFLQIANSRGQAQAEIIKDYLKERQDANP